MTWYVIAPEYRSYPPNTVTVTTGTGTGTVNELSTVDTLVYSVLEEDVGVSVWPKPRETWIVQGTLESGTFAACVQNLDGTGCVYQEADDDNGALTGDSVLLTPEGVGKYTQWSGTYPAARPHWQMVDDDPPHDGNTTAIWTVIDGGVDSYAMEDLSVFPPGAKEAGSVTLFAWASDDGAVWNGQVANFVRTVSADYNSSYYDLPDWEAWRNLTTNHATNPNTGVEWTLAQINAMEVGVTAGPNLAGAPLWVSSVGAVVPLQYINYVLDVRYNITGVPAGREYYSLRVTALTDPGEDVTVSVYDHVALGWDTAFVIANSTYDTRNFGLIEADHVNAGEVWLRYTDAGGDTSVADRFDVDFVFVRAWDVEYTLDVSFNWVGLDSQRDPRLSVVGYKSDAELMTLQVLRSGAWTTLDANMFVVGVMTSWAFTLAPIDVEGGTLRVRFIDNDITDNAASTIYLDLLTLRIEMVDEAPAAPIDVYVAVSYNLWGNEIILSVRWVQTGGPEPALERGKWVTVWADGVEVGTYTVGDDARRITAPWSLFDGRDHNVTAIGAVNVEWPTWQGWQTYFSDPELETISNFPRFAVLMFGLFCLLAIVAIIAVRAIKRRREDDEGP